jgi:hypothetical protein
MSINFVNGELCFLFSSIINVARNECFGESRRYLKFLAAIRDPIGDCIAISRVSSSLSGTYRIVSPFSIAPDAWTPL